jgi:hypothetical protein
MKRTIDRLHYARQWLYLAALASLYMIEETVVRPALRDLRARPRTVLLRLYAFLFATQAFAVDPLLAQSFPRPVDMPVPSGPAPLYKTDGTLNVTIDPTVTPPPFAGLTNIAIPSTTNRIVTTAAQGPGSPFCTLIADGGTCAEYKFRTHVDCGYILNDDPQRNFFQFGKSHLHEFCGGGSVNAGSTYKTRRQHALDSLAAGTDANGTGYWRPCTEVFNPYGDGKDFCILDDFWIVYYVGDPGKKLALIPVGMQGVWGFDMDSSVPTFGGTNGQYAWLQTILDTANAAYIAGGGSGPRYSLTFNGSMETSPVYNCVGATPSQVKVLVTSTGTDPYNGTCAAGAQFYWAINGPKCWNGSDPWSPGSYKHWIPGVWDTVANAFVCPYNYYQTPFVRTEGQINQQGWSDRQRWCLSSDIAYRAAHSLTAAQVPCGTTLHEDWADGWDHATVFDPAQRNCAGAMGVQGKECDSSYFSSTQYLKGGLVGESGANGRAPQVDFTGLSHVLETDPGWRQVPNNPMNSVTGMGMKH